MNHLLTNSEDEDNEEILYDFESLFGQFVEDRLARAPKNSDPMELLISLEDLVIEKYGEVVLRAHKAQVRIKHPRR